MNKLVGILLIIKGIQTILDKTISGSLYVDKYVDGWQLYIYAIPLVLLCIYVLYLDYKR